MIYPPAPDIWSSELLFRQSQAVSALKEEAGVGTWSWRGSPHSPRWMPPWVAEHFHAASVRLLDASATPADHECMDKQRVQGPSGIIVSTTAVRKRLSETKTPQRDRHRSALPSEVPASVSCQKEGQEKDQCNTAEKKALIVHYCATCLPRVTLAAISEADFSIEVDR